MKKIAMIGIIILLSGCIEYGSGVTKGYVYSVDHGMFWHQVWIKPDLTSSETDCYIFDSQEMYQILIEKMENKSVVTLGYTQNIGSWTDCNPQGIVKTIK